MDRISILYGYAVVPPKVSAKMVEFVKPTRSENFLHWLHDAWCWVILPSLCFQAVMILVALMVRVAFHIAGVD